MVKHRIVTKKWLIMKIWSPVFNSQFWDFCLLAEARMESFFFEKYQDEKLNRQDGFATKGQVGKKGKAVT